MPILLAVNAIESKVKSFSVVTCHRGFSPVIYSEMKTGNRFEG